MHRHHENIRLPAAHYLGQRRYFVTLCCAQRHAAFANSETAAHVIKELHAQSIHHNFAVEAYCAMPDHFHILARGLNPTANLLNLVVDFKQQTAHNYRQKHGRELWQKKFYDHILRQGDPAESVANYIWQNPVRQGICADPREYPFSGSFIHDWKNLISPPEFWRPPWKGNRTR
jgi:putative transposase